MRPQITSSHCIWWKEFQGKNEKRRQRDQDSHNDRRAQGQKDWPFKVWAKKKEEGEKKKKMKRKTSDHVAFRIKGNKFMVKRETFFFFLFFLFIFFLSFSLLLFLQEKTKGKTNKGKNATRTKKSERHTAGRWKRKQRKTRTRTRTGLDLLRGLLSWLLVAGHVSLQNREARPQQAGEGALVQRAAFQLPLRGDRGPARLVI